MAELEDIAEALRDQRRSLEDELERTQSRRISAAELVDKIQDLRVRAERTQQLFPPEATEAVQTDLK